MKHCSLCNQDKPLDQFYVQKQKDKTTRMSSYCRKCFRVHYIEPRNRQQAAEKREERLRMMGIQATDLPGEVWVDIEGYDNYLISNKGRIKSVFPHHIKFKVISFNKHTGYYQVNLTKNGKPGTQYFHRLFAKAFVPNPHNYPDINHIDGDKANNDISNLEWCTHQHNMLHAIHVLKRHGSITLAKRRKEKENE